MKMCPLFLSILLAFICKAGAVSIETISAPDGDSPSTSINTSGSKAAAWVGFENDHMLIKAALCSSLWSLPWTISDESHDANYPKIQINDSDHALVVWVEFDGSYCLLKSSFYSGGIWGSPQDFGGSWSDPVTISDAVCNVSELDMSFNNSGDAVVVWTQETELGYVVYSSFYSGGSWSTPQAISNSAFDAANPVAALSDDGTVVAAWLQSTGSRQIVRARVFSEGVWGSTSTLSLSEEDAYLIKPVINSTGQAIVIWEKTSNTNQICANIFSGGSWVGPQVVSSSESAGTPDIAINDDGEAVAVWQEFDGSNTVAAGAVYTLNTWQDPFVISSDPLTSNVVASSKGNVAGRVAWVSNDGFSDTVNVMFFNSLPQFGGMLPSGSTVQYAIPEGQSLWNLQFAASSSGEISLIGNYFNGTDYVIGSFE